MSYVIRTLLAVALVGFLGWPLALPDAAQAGQAKAEVRWLHGPVGIEMWAKGSGSFPSRKDVAEQAWFKEKKLFQVFVQQLLLPNAKSPNLGMPNAVELNKALTVEIQNVLQGKKGAKQALDDAAVEWNKVLANYQQ